MKTAQFLKALSVLDRRLQSAAVRIADVPQKPEDVQQVRFSGRIRADDICDLLQGNINLAKVPPVREFQSADIHGRSYPRCAMACGMIVVTIEASNAS